MTYSIVARDPHTGELGVYESAQYIRSLGGDIRVESAPGTGTSICVLLPRADSTPLAPEVKREVA